MKHLILPLSLLLIASSLYPAATPSILPMDGRTPIFMGAQPTTQPPIIPAPIIDAGMPPTAGQTPPATAMDAMTSTPAALPIPAPVSPVAPTFDISTAPKIIDLNERLTPVLVPTAFTASTTNNEVEAPVPTMPEIPKIEPIIIPNLNPAPALLEPAAAPMPLSSFKMPEIEKSSPVGNTRAKEIKKDVKKDVKKDEDEESSKDNDKDNEIDEQEDNDQEETIPSSHHNDEQEIIVLNSTGHLICVYGQTHEKEVCIAQNLGPIAQILIKTSFDFIRIESQNHATSESYDSVIENKNLSIISVKNSTAIDKEEESLEIEAIEQTSEQGILVYNTTTSSQQIKATYPQDASFFSTPKIYYTIPALSARFMTLPILNEKGMQTKVYVTLPHGQNKILIPNGTKHTICVIHAEDSMTMIDDVTEDFRR